MRRRKQAAAEIDLTVASGVHAHLNLVEVGTPPAMLRVPAALSPTNAEGGAIDEQAAGHGEYARAAGADGDMVIIGMFQRATAEIEVARFRRRVPRQTNCW